MSRSLWFVWAAVVVVSQTGCYRLRSPPPLDEAIRITILGNESRLPRSQAYLQQMVARKLVENLGWRVSPLGSAKLELVLQTEEISSAANDRRDITTFWQYTIRGQAVFTSRLVGPIGERFNGVGFVGAIEKEPQALAAAAEDAAEDIADWLDDTMSDYYEDERDTALARGVAHERQQALARAAAIRDLMALASPPATAAVSAPATAAISGNR